MTTEVGDNLAQQGDPSPWRAAVVLGLFALVVRLLYVWLIVSRYGLTQYGDALFLAELAESLASGRGFTLGGVRIYNQSVGYPLFLSLLYRINAPDVRLALAANVCLGALSVMLVVLLAARLRRGLVRQGGPGGTAVVWGTGALAALYPDSLLYTATTQTENLLVPLLLLLLLAVLREGGDWISGIVTGVMAAAAASVKAHVILVCAFLPIVWMVMRVNAWKRVVAATVIGGICLLPWTLVNLRDSGRFIPFAAIAGSVFLDCTNPEAQGKPTNRYQLPAEEEAGHTEIELNDMRMRRAMEYIWRDPIWYVGLLAKKLLFSASPARDFMFEFEGQTRMFTPFLSRWVTTAFNAALLLGTALGLVAAWRDPVALGVGASLLSASALLQLIFCAFPRYRFPFLYGLLPIATWGTLLALQRAWVTAARVRGRSA